VRYFLDKSILLQGRPTALECAAAFGKLGIIAEYITSKFGSQLKQDELGYALWIASDSGNVELAMLLFEVLQSRSTEELLATVDWQGDAYHRSRDGRIMPSMTQPVSRSYMLYT
jgi:hypothetical protein